MTPDWTLYHAELPGGGSRFWADSPVSTDEWRSRSPFGPELLDRLSGARVLILGAGSGGSKLALDLARAGVGQLVLADPGRLMPHNLSRHLGRLDQVGLPKVEAVAREVLARVPGVVVETFPLDLFAPGGPDPAELAGGCSLLIGATDRLPVQLALNGLAWQVRRPALFGGCYEAARGGEVFFTLPGEGTPCLACLRGGLAAPPPDGMFDYSAARSLEDYQAQPGLSAAVDWITDAETQVALALLLRGQDHPLAFLADPRLCFLLLGGAAGAGYYRFTRPFDVHHQPLAGPRLDCPVCQPVLPPEEGMALPDGPDWQEEEG